MPDALPGARFAPAYDTSTAGVVIDQVTGLVWQRRLGEESAGYSWIAASVYCDALNLGGHDDWRLPTKIELESIIDETQRPAIDRFAFVDDGTIVWTASPVVGEPDYVWLVDFINGSSAFFIRRRSPRPRAST